MKRLLTALYLSASLPVFGYEMTIRAGNEELAQKQCLALLGSGAKVSGVQHHVDGMAGKVTTIYVHYVLATCGDNTLTPLKAAERLASVLEFDEFELPSIAAGELKKIGLYNGYILDKAIAALKISQIYVARDLMDFLSHGGPHAALLVLGRLEDTEADIRYKASHTLFLSALRGNVETLEPYLPYFEQRYVAEQTDQGFMPPHNYKLGVKVNLVRILGLMGDKAPLSFIQKLVSDLSDVFLASEYAYVSYEGAATLAEVGTKALGQIGEPAIPTLASALLEHAGGPFLNGESFLLLAAEAMGEKGKALIPILQQILKEGQSHYPKRVQLAIDRLSTFVF